MRRIYTTIVVLALMTWLSPRAAKARAFTIHVECCGDFVYVDCQARSTGAVECRDGHKLDHVTDPGFSLSCIGVGCIGPSPSEFMCQPEIPDGTTVACQANVRSCQAQPGTVKCGGGRVCTGSALANIDFCPKPACLGGTINNTDTDGDGLFDCWEDQGIDYDGDGTVDLNLPALGVNKNKKDVLVEIDSFSCAVPGGDCAKGSDAGPPDLHTHLPLAPAITVVQNAFAAAPVMNPDGTSGINLIVSVDEALPHSNSCPFDSTCFGPIKLASFGTPAERMNPNPLFQVSNTVLAKRVAFHYSLWAHDLGPGVGSSGKANEPGGNLMVTLGTGWSRTSSQQTGTFMHELGHNLGLGHGGGDEINFKPNYFSVMNYQWQFGLLPVVTFDYSRVALPALVETNLREPAGIGDGGFTPFFVCPNGSTGTGAASGPLNWDCLPPPDMATEIGLTIDINNDRQCLFPGPNQTIDTIPGGDDVLAGGRIGPGPDGILQTIPLMGSDDVIIGTSIFPGGDGIMQTRPAAGSDDVLIGQIVWDGPNRICQTGIAPGTDDVGNSAQTVTVGTVEPATLNGFNDWSNLQLDFVPTLVGFSGGPVSKAPEMDLSTAAEIEVTHTIADLSIGQKSTGREDGSVTYTITITNNGPDSAISPTINDNLPSTLTAVSCRVVTGPGTCKVLGNYVAVAFPTLAAGASGVVEVTAHKAAPVASLTNVATVEALSTDPARGNNVSSDCLSSPVVTLGQPLTLIEDVIERQLGRSKHDRAISLSLSECVGKKTFADACAGPMDVDRFGQIESVELVPLTEHRSRVPSKILEEFERERFFRAGCPGLAISGPTTFEIPLDQLEPNRPVRYAVHFVVRDPKGAAVRAICDVTVVDNLREAEEAKVHPFLPVGCALCEGTGCPHSCPSKAQVCRRHRDDRDRNDRQRDDQ